jgi:hypothetical protein
MKIALAIIALLAAIPLTTLAEKDKAKSKDIQVEVKVPDKSGISIEDINVPAKAGIYTFKVKNSNSYAVHISGNIFQGYAFYPFDMSVKANSSELFTSGQGAGTPLVKIVVDKVEKKD